MRASLLLIVGAAVTVLVASSQAGTIEFSGYRWIAKSGDRVGPGPNSWDENNVWVDQDGRLHLALTRRKTHWYCAEVSTLARLGFGRYEFWVSGPIDKLDANVVFGLFSYPTGDIGADGTHEIDIEFARWGKPRMPIGNYTVWPARQGLQRAHESTAVELDGRASGHRFVRAPTTVKFQSLRGHDGDDQNEVAGWLYKPTDPQSFISQEPMPIHMNLWLFNGYPPADRKEIELIVDHFRFIPE
jgi:hypothetical protein